MALAWSGRYPFGKVPYGIGDAGWQLVSFYGSYWDMLHLRTASSPFFNWEYGMGVPYFGDWVNYSASPYLLLLWFFPRNMLEFALMFITGLILATAAAAMAAFQTKFLAQVPYRAELADQLRGQIAPTSGKARVAYFEHADLPWNQGPAYGVVSSSYSSSLMPYELGVEIPQRYGFPTQAGGRMVRTGEDPIAGVISAATRIVTIKGDKGEVVEIAAVPFARKIPTDLEISTSDPYQARSDLLGTNIYVAPPQLTVVDAEGQTSTVQPDGDFLMKSGKTVHVTGQCPAGTYPQFLVPGASFGAKVDDRPSDRVRQGVILSGRSNKAVFHLVVGKDTSIPASQFACASYKLAAQAANEMEPVEVALSGKTMTLQATSTDPVLIATAFSPQWQCSNATTDGSTGFLTVRPQKEGEVSCTFKTVGLMPGVTVSAVTLLAIAVGAFLWRRKQGAKK